MVAETMDLEHLDPFHKKEQNPEDPVVVAVDPQEEQHQTEMVHLELPTKDMPVVTVILDHQQLLILVVAAVVLVVLQLIQEMLRQVELVALD